MIIEARFGGFPSGIQDVGLAKLRCSHMGALYNAHKYNDPALLIEVLQQVCDYDIQKMTDDDLRYLLVLVDRVSYTEDTRIVNWRCHAAQWARQTDDPELKKVVFTNPFDPEFKKGSCNSLNTTDVRYKVNVGKTRQLPHGMQHPRVSTMVQAADLVANGYNEDLVQAARWVDSDWPLVDVVNDLSLAELAAIKLHMYCALTVSQSLRCNFCPAQHTVTSDLDIMKFLRVFSEKSMMNMQFNLNTLFNASLPEDMPIKTLLYHHGCYLQDKREADKRRRELEAARRGTRGRK